MANKAQGSTATARPLEEVTCFKCGQKGHYANKVRAPRCSPTRRILTPGAHHARRRAVPEQARAAAAGRLPAAEHRCARRRRRRRQRQRRSVAAATPIVGTAVGASAVPSIQRLPTADVTSLTAARERERERVCSLVYTALRLVYTQRDAKERDDPTRQQPLHTSVGSSWIVGWLDGSDGSAAWLVGWRGSAAARLSRRTQARPRRGTP